MTTTRCRDLSTVPTILHLKDKLPFAITGFVDFVSRPNKQTNKNKSIHSMAFSPEANYTGRATAAIGEVTAGFCR
jgi:hypothetical protein